MAFLVTVSAAFLCMAVVLLAALPLEASAQKFLGDELDVVNRGRVVEQLYSMMGHGQSSNRMQGVKDMLRSTYMALPQDARGGLDHRVARYALYRYFLVEHGWHVKGLPLEVDVNHVPSTTILKSQMPTFIMDLLRKHLGSDRVELEDLALLAVTIENLVQADAMDLLEMSYRTHGFATGELLSTEEADLVARTFVLFFLMPASHDHFEDRPFIRTLVDGDALRFYTGWDDAKLWILDLRESLEYQDRIALRPFAAIAGQRLEYSSVASWVTAISAGAGRFTNVECKELKSSMLDLEDVERDDGRVALAKFYAPYKADESWHFSESPAYLRHIGALDEHNPRQPSAIVPNVIYSKANCLSTVGFHSICCVDDCEVLMAELERHARQPAAAPELIERVVSTMPSDTVAAPRILDAQLVSRLYSIADRHSGTVPLHSRLFAQWMHYAFPNECPLPQSSHTSEAQLTIREWSDKTKLSPTVSQEEMEEVTKLMNGSHTESSEAFAAPWSEDEQLLRDRPARRPLPFSVFHAVACATVFAASAFAILGAAGASLGELLVGRRGKPSGLSAPALRAPPF